MKDPLISIITVCWNAVDTISETLESVISQSYKNVEHIVVDGVSTDGTFKILQKYSDAHKHIKVTSEKDNGIYDAMNKGVKMCSGDLVFFLNSGDKFYDGRVLHDIVHTFKENPSAQVIAGDVQVTDNGKDIFVKKHNDLTTPYLMNESICHQGLFFSRDALIEFPFDLKYKIASDFDMFLKTFKKYSKNIIYRERLIAFYPLGGASSPSDPRKYERINREFREIRVRHFGKLMYLQYEYKKFGLKGFLKAFIGKKFYKYLVIFGKYGYHIVTRLALQSYSLILKGTFATKKRRKNTLLLVAEFDKFGGTRTFFLDLLDYYHNRKLNVVLLCNRSQIDDSLIANFQGKNIEVEYFGNKDKFLPRLKKLNFLRESLFYIHTVAKLFMKHRFSLITISVGTPGLYCQMLKVPSKVIYYLHSYPTTDQHKLLKWVIKSSLNRSKTLISVSETSVSMISNYFGLKPTNIKVIYNQAGSINEDLPTSNQKSNIVLTVGHVNSYKNPLFWIDVALEVLKYEPDTKFMWIGDGELLNKCTEIISNNNKISFIGRKDRSDVQRYISDATIYFQPSLLESFGLAVVEAMKQSKPVVVSNAGGLMEVVTDEVGIRVSNFDKQLYAKEIIALLKSPEKRAELGKMGRKRFENKFSKEIWDTKLDDLHKNILNIYN